MNTKHTPGPWYNSTANPHAVNKDGKGLAIGIATTHGTDDANYSDFFPSTEEAQANARLIAAAPELLEALQMLSDTAGRIAQGAAYIDERGFNMLAHPLSVALAAIAKATNQ